MKEFQREQVHKYKVPNPRHIILEVRKWGKKSILEEFRLAWHIVNLSLQRDYLS